MNSPPVEDEAALKRCVRTLITVADNVRRGVIPPRVLHKIVTPDVADGIIAEFPSTTGVCEVRTVTVQQPYPLRTYFTGTAIRPDGSAIAYLGLVCRKAQSEPWKVTQILPVTEQTVGRMIDGRLIAPNPEQIATFRTVIAEGYLDPMIQLLGPMPLSKEDGARRDWLEAAAAIVDHAHTQHLRPGTIVADLDQEPVQALDSWQEARRYIDAYLTAYDIDLARYATHEQRLDAIRGTPTEQTVERTGGPELEAGL